MHALFAAVALAFATTIIPGPAPAAETVLPAVPAPIRAAAPRRQRRHDRIAIATPAGSSYDDAVLRQIDLHVLMPALTGDGGG